MRIKNAHIEKEQVGSVEELFNSSKNMLGIMRALPILEENKDTHFKLYIDVLANYLQFSVLRGLKQYYKDKNNFEAVKLVNQKLKYSDLLREKDIKISACIIAKNEEDYIEECLNSIKNQVDEIIVVDTGSSDSTKEIASKYTNKIYSFVEEPFNFSNARRESVKYASNEWIFIIDADEVLVENYVNASLRKSIYNAVNKSFDSLCFKMMHLPDNKLGNFSNTRIIRKDYILFELPIHNQIFGHLISVGDSNFYLKHYGYTEERRKKSGRHIQTMNSLIDVIKEKESKNEVSDYSYFYSLYQLGVSNLEKIKLSGVLNYTEEQCFENLNIFAKAYNGKSLFPEHVSLQILDYSLRLLTALGDNESILKLKEEIESYSLYSLDCDFFLFFAFIELNKLEEAKIIGERFLSKVDNLEQSELIHYHVDKKEVIQNILKEVVYA